MTFPTYCQSTQKHREKPGVCPACHCQGATTIGCIGYEATLGKWGLSPEAVRELLAIELGAIRFEWRQCSKCGCQWTPESPAGLVEYVETHFAMGEEIAASWFSAQHPLVDGEWVERITSSSDLNAYEDRHSRTLELVNRWLGKRRTFLDLGTCYGTTAAMMAIVHPGLEVSMCEPSPLFSKVARQRYPHITLFDQPLEISGNQRFDCIYWSCPR